MAERQADVDTSARDDRQQHQQQPEPGERGFLERHGNTLLIVATLVVAVVVLVRYRRAQAAEAARLVGADLTAARLTLEEIRAINPLANAADLDAERQRLAGEVESALARLDGSDEPDVRAEALAIRGDLNWVLGSRPPTTQPTGLRPAGEYLADAEAAYKQVLDAHAGEELPATAARFGLAAIAEQRGDWAAARAQYDAVLADAESLQSHKALATSRRDLLDQISRPVYRSPAPATAPVAAAATPIAAPQTPELPVPETAPTTTTPTPVVP